MIAKLRLVVFSSCLEFTRCDSSQCAFSYILLNCLLVMFFFIKMSEMAISTTRGRLTGTF